MNDDPVDQHSNRRPMPAEDLQHEAQWAGTHQDLLRVVRSVRRRWRLRNLLRGAALTLAVGLVVVLGSALVLDQFLYTERAVTMMRWFSWIFVGLIAVRFLLVPQLQRASDRRVALYIEEHEPSLQSAVISAVELGDTNDTEPSMTRQASSPELQRRMLVDAIQRCEQVDYAQGIERGALRRMSGALAGVAGAGLLAVLLSPAFLQHGAMLLLMPWKALAADNPYQVLVHPGSVEMAKGADALITARLVGFDSPRVTLRVREGQGDWEEYEMAASGAQGTAGGEMSMSERGIEVFGVAEGVSDRELLILDLRDDTEYFVEANGIRSPVHRIDVVELPYTERIDLRYQFPAYTGLPPQEILDGGDVTVLRGTTVEVRVAPTVRVAGGRLRIDEETVIELQPIKREASSEGSTEAATESEGEAAAASLATDLAAREQAEPSWSATFEVQDRGFYLVELDDLRGKQHRGSPDYAIQPLDDQPPVLRVKRPGRDLKVNKIEEVFVEAEANDDFGVARLDLKYSVNGEEEETVQLVRGRARKQVTAGHTFFLEEIELQDGDFVSYYFEARDANRGSTQKAASDIYFLEIRPFGQEYRKAEGGGGMQGGGGNETGLSARQREIVAATFRLTRDRDSMGKKELSESIATVALSQQRLREQASTLIERMRNRVTLSEDEDFGVIIGHLEKSLPEMDEAFALLQREKPATAIGPEQRAMTHLQRAESTFRDVRVSFDPGGGGGGGESQLSEDLADLFELELDKLRNQYEVVQRGQEQQAAQELDEVEQRLKELARRQQQELERKRRQSGQRAQEGGGGGRQQQMIEETEELARRLEKLAREQSRPELRQTAQRLREAVDQMRQTSSSGGQSGRQGTRSGAQALESLEEARRLLDKNRELRIDEEMQELAEQSQRLQGLQQKISDQVRSMAQRQRLEGAGGRSGRPDGSGQQGESASEGSSGERSAAAAREELDRLLQRKEQLESEISGLEEQLDRMARQARAERPEVARNLQQAANSIRKNQLKEKVRYSKGVVREREAEIAEAFEREIDSNLEELFGELGEAQQAMGDGEGADSEDLLAQARGLVESLQSLEGRLRDRLEGQQGEQDQPGQGGEPGDQGERQPGSEGGEEPGAGGEGSSQRGEEGDASQQNRSGESAGEGSQGSQPGEGAGESGQPGEGEGRGQQGSQSQAESSSAEQGSGQSSRAGEQSGSRGTQRDGQGIATSQMGLSSSGSFQPGLFGNQELRQMGRELSERIRQAEELRSDLQEAQMDTADLDDVLRQMRQLRIRDIVGDPLALGALREAVVEGLRQFEFRLWRDLEGEGRQVLAPDREEVPAGYEGSVDEYFKSLARRDR